LETGKGNFIEISNTPLYYEEIIVTADEFAPVLIFLHDALGSAGQWKEFPKLLAERVGLNAVVYDRRGYGRSTSVEKRTKDYLHREAGIILPEFLKKLNIKNPILFGHSDGGSIALLHAAKFDPLAIVCEAAHVLVEKETIAGIEKAVGQKLFLIRKLKKYHGEKTEKLFADWHETWLDPDFQNWNIEAGLKNINCPALIVQGELDEYATRGHLGRIERGIGENARSGLIKNCGHIPHLEASDEILERTSEFIRNVLA
jgi:pimeloyl-ACP methyl ester carboxylesterase